MSKRKRGQDRVLSKCFCGAKVRYDEGAFTALAFAHETPFTTEPSGERKTI
jgi:hypothetical protein